MARITWRRVIKVAVVLVLFSVLPYILIHTLDSRQKNGDRAAKSTVERSDLRVDKENLSVRFLRSQLPFNTRITMSQLVTPLRGIQAVTDYCNSPSRATTGKEGRTIQGFKIKMVHVFTRHGDRSSMHRTPEFKPADLSCKFSTWYTGKNSRFQEFPMRINWMSGKQENRFLGWALYPDKDRCPEAALTSRGTLQHLRLGEHIHNSYFNRTNLFSKNIDLKSQILVTSTGLKRTFQSAVALLYGFLPDFNISSIGIKHSENLQFCTTNQFHQKMCSCRHPKDLLSNAKSYISEISRNNSFLKNHRRSISKLFKIENLASLSNVADAVVPGFCHNVPPMCPSYRTYGCVSAEILGNIWDVLIAQELSHRDDPHLNYKRFCSIVMNPVLKEIHNRIKEFIKGRSTAKFILYSGHDVTLTPLLHALGIDDGRWPPFASRIVFELFEHNDTFAKNRFYLKFLYNGVDKTEDVLFCRGRLYRGLCSFSHFSDFVLKEMLGRFGYSSYKEACNRKSTV